jgi:hypothetical protein
MYFGTKSYLKSNHYHTPKQSEADSLWQTEREKEEISYKEKEKESPL